MDDKITIEKNENGNFVMSIYRETGEIRTVELPSEITVEVKGDFTNEFIQDVKEIHGVTLRPV